MKKLILFLLISISLCSCAWANVLLGTWESELYTVNPETVALTSIGNTGKYMDTLSFRNDGVLFGTWEHELYTINLATAALTFVGDTNGKYLDTLSFRYDGVLFGTREQELYTQLRHFRLFE